MSKPLFELGRVVATPGALAALGRAEVNPADLIHRHVTGDWADMDVEDQAANKSALLLGGRVFSSYEIGPDTRVWVITEWDRSSTCLMLPDEY